MPLLLYYIQNAFLIQTKLSAFPRVVVSVQGGKNLAPRLISSTSLSPCIGPWVKQILTFWADGLAVGLVDLLTSLRNFVYLPSFLLFFMEMGGWGARSTDPTGIYHIISLTKNWSWDQCDEHVTMYIKIDDHWRPIWGRISGQTGHLRPIWVLKVAWVGFFELIQFVWFSTFWLLSVIYYAGSLR